jgi:citrate synthase
MLIMSSDTRKGLAGVIVDETAISRVGENIDLLYRGYKIEDVATHCTLAESAWMILFGDLPTGTQLDEFRKNKRQQREISDNLLTVIRQFPATGNPMERLRTAVSFLGMEDPEADDHRPEANLEKAIRLLARIPTIVATDYRYRHGLERIPPRTDLGFAANFFHMCFGEVPEDTVLRSFETALILYAELSFAPSTFACRTVASSLSDIYSAVTAGLGSLKGPLHGGAPAGVMNMLLEIGEPENAQAWIDQALAEKRTIIGFGHRIFKLGDPRATIMYSILKNLAKLRDGQKWLEIQEILAKTMLEKRGLYPNVDYLSGPSYYLMGFEVDLFTPIFAMSRTSGWTAHIMEQIASNKLIRPIGTYVGPAERKVPRKRSRK